LLALFTALFLIINDLRPCDNVTVAVVFKFDLAVVLLTVDLVLTAGFLVIAVLSAFFASFAAFLASLVSLSFLTLYASLLVSLNLKTPLA
jgi:hypothetical protein